MAYEVICTDDRDPSKEVTVYMGVTHFEDYKLQGRVLFQFEAFASKAARNAGGKAYSASALVPVLQLTKWTEQVAEIPGAPAELDADGNVVTPEIPGVPATTIEHDDYAAYREVIGAGYDPIRYAYEEAKRNENPVNSALKALALSAKDIK